MFAAKYRTKFSEFIWTVICLKNDQMSALAYHFICIFQSSLFKHFQAVSVRSFANLFHVTQTYTISQSTFPMVRICCICPLLIHSFIGKVSSYIHGSQIDYLGKCSIKDALNSVIERHDPLHADFTAMWK